MLLCLHVAEGVKVLHLLGAMAMQLVFLAT
jgi:hypothetical protein